MSFDDAAMWEITSENAADYLRASGRVAEGDSIAVRELTGGVSNVVLYVRQTADTRSNTENRQRSFVLKQARPQLRVAQPWFCNVERSWRELAVLRACDAILAGSAAHGAAEPMGRRNDELQAPVATTPSVLWEDRENYVFAMSAAPVDHVVWKQCLLSTPSDPRFAHSNLPIAAACGRLLGRLHAASWNDATLRGELGDTSLFDALRIDPYYRRIASVHSDLRPHVDRLVDSLSTNARALVHADFSPKNLLVSQSGGEMQLMMVDFETGHFGDPAFDLGFFLSHLTLKAIHHAPRHEPLLALADRFWTSYAETMREDTTLDGQSDERQSLADRAMQHLAGCVIARIDGKSPVEYLVEPARRETARSFGRAIFNDAATCWPAAKERLQRMLEASG
ncbi:MAG: phosphotransferase [Pirellulales bacterium]